MSGQPFFPFKKSEQPQIVAFNRIVLNCNIHVVVNFLSQVIFIFSLSLGMVIYANEFETKEKQKLPEIKN